MRTLTENVNRIRSVRNIPNASNSGRGISHNVAQLLLTDSPASPLPQAFLNPTPTDPTTTSQQQAQNTVEDIIGRTITNALGGTGPSFPSSQGPVPPALPMDYENTNPRPVASTSTSASTPDPSPGSRTPTNPTPPNASVPGAPPPVRNYQLFGEGGASGFGSRLTRDFNPDGVQEHSRFCPYGEGMGGGRAPSSRMRTLSDMGEIPTLHIWPTVETGHERNTRSFRLCREDPRSGAPVSTNPNMAVNPSLPDRNNNRNTVGGEGGNGFPSFGNWMGQGPPWMNNDLGVRVYLTVRQFNERINSLRNERDQLMAERDQLLSRRARVTTALARAERAATARTTEREGPESWQRNFNSGVALVPSNVREGSRNYGRSLSSRSSNNNSTQTQLPPPSTGTVSSTCALHSSSTRTRTEAHNSSASTATCTGASVGRTNENSTSSSHPSSSSARGDEESRRRSGQGQSRRDPPTTLDGNFQRMTFIRLGEDFIPVYSSNLRERDIPQQNVFVYPIGLFLEGSGWSTTSVAIYWPLASREEEERYHTFIPFSFSTQTLIYIYILIKYFYFDLSAV